MYAEADDATGASEEALPTHRRLQVEFLALGLADAPGRRLLDFGCSGGFYMTAARELGLEASGVEYDAEYSQRVARAVGLPVTTLDRLEAERPAPFDIIHVGHVLEHVAAPAALVRRLMPLAQPTTLWLFDGPLENNRCLSRFVIDIGSRLKRRPYQEIEPQHLSATTARAQRDFFERLGFTALRFEIREQAWPLPETFPGWSPALLGRFALARVSIGLSRWLPGCGNLFHFAGRRGVPAV